MAGLAATASPTVLVITTIAVATVLSRRGVRLGAPLPPFYWFSRPRLTVWLAPSSIVLLAIAAATPPLLQRKRRFLPLTLLAALITRSALNVARYGPHELVRPLTGHEGEHEYLPTVPRFLDHPLAYLANFPHLARTQLPIHASGHPPGPTVVLAALSAAGVGGAWWEAIFILVAGSLTVVPLYWLAREFTDEMGARISVLVWIFAPNVLLESATSFDAIFALAATTAALFIVRRRAVVAGVLFATATFLSYGVVTIVPWGLVVVRRRTNGWRPVLQSAVMTACVTVSCYGLLAVTTGYDPIAAYQATKYVYQHGVSRDRPLWFWFFGDQATFLVGLGLPSIYLFGRALRYGDSNAVGLALTIIAAAATGFTKAEVERIWLFLVPLAAIALASQLSPRLLRPIIILLAMQALMTEILVGTTW